MSSRHTRRKQAKAKQERKLLGLAQAARSHMIATIVRTNLSAPVSHLISEEYGISGKRNYYPSSNMGRLAELSHRGYVGGQRTYSREGKIVQGKFVPKR